MPDNVMKLVVNNEIENKPVELTFSDMEKVVEYADWMAQFGVEASLGLMCTLFDVLETKIDGFNAVGASEAVAASVYHVHELDGGLSK